MSKVNYLKVTSLEVSSIKKKVFSLPCEKRKQYYPLLNSLSNNFYGSTKYYYKMYFISIYFVENI